MLDLPATSAMVVGNPGIEPGRHKGAGFTGPLSPQTWRYPERSVLERASRGYEPPRGLLPLGIAKGAEAANASAAPAYVRPGTIVHGGEPRT